MGTQGAGRKRNPNKERSTAEDDTLNLIAREAEARLAAKRAARAEAREIRMKELERQQKEIFQVQKKYYGLDTKSEDRGDNKWGTIEQWMEDNERYSRPSRTTTLSDEDERMSVGSRSSVMSSSLHSQKKSKKKKKHKHKDRDDNGVDDGYSAISSRSSRLSDESRASRSSRLDLTSSRLSEDSRVSRASRLDLQPASYVSSELYGSSLARQTAPLYNGYQSSLYEDGLRLPGSSSRPSDYSSFRGSRASSRTSSARTSPVENCSSVASFLRSAGSSVLPKDLDDITIPDLSNVEDGDYIEKGSRAASALTAGTLTSLGGTSSRRGSGETAVTVDNETSIREIKEIHELKDQIQDVESKYMQNLKEVKDASVEVGEKYRKAMVSNAQLDNEKNNLMYQVDTLKDSLSELEELLAESRREYQEKVKDHDREKNAHGILQFQFNEMKESLKQSEELLSKHGIVLGPDLNINGDIVGPGTDGSSEPGSGQGPDSQMSPTEGGGSSSMLGNVLESELRSKQEEEMDSEETQEPQMLDEAKESFLTSAEPCSLDGISTTETSRDGDLACLPKVGDSVEESAPCPEMLDVQNAGVITNIQDSTTDLDGVITKQQETVEQSALGGLRLDLDKAMNMKGSPSEWDGVSPDMGDNAVLAVASGEVTETVEEGDFQQTSTEGTENKSIIREVSEAIVAKVMSAIAQMSSKDFHEDLVTNRDDIQSNTPTPSNVDESLKKEGEVVTNIEDLPDESFPIAPIGKSQPEPGNIENEELSTKPQTQAAAGKKKKKKRKGKKKKGEVQGEEKQTENENVRSLPEKENDTIKKDSELSTKDDGWVMGSEISSSPLKVLKGSHMEMNQDKVNVLDPEVVEPQVCCPVSNAESNLDVSDPYVNSERINSTDVLDVVNAPCLASPLQESVLPAKADASQIDPEITAVAIDETGSMNEISSEHTTLNPTDSFEAPDRYQTGETQGSTSVDLSHAVNDSQSEDNAEQSNTSTLPVCLEGTSGPQGPLETIIFTDQVTLGNNHVDLKSDTPLGDTFQIEDSKDQNVGKEERQTSSSCNSVCALAHCDEVELDNMRKEEETLDQADHSAGISNGALADKTCTDMSNDVSSCPKEGVDFNSSVFEENRDGTNLAIGISSETERIMVVNEVSLPIKKPSDLGWAVPEGRDQSQFDTSLCPVEDQEDKVSKIEEWETKSEEFTEIHSFPSENNDGGSAVPEELQQDSDQSHVQGCETLSYPVEDQYNLICTIKEGETQSPQVFQLDYEDVEDGKNGQSFDFDEMDLEPSISVISVTATSEEAQDTHGEDFKLGRPKASEKRVQEGFEIRTEGDPLENTEETVTVGENIRESSLDHKGSTSPQGPQNTTEQDTFKMADEEIDQLQSLVEQNKQRDTLKEGEVERHGGSGGLEFEMEKEALVLPIYKGQEVMKGGLQGGPPGVGNKEDEVSSQTAELPTKKDSKNGNKAKGKGKGKGKEDCKMS